MEDAKICADVLLESDRRGIESHGCNRFKPIYLDRIKKGTLLPVTKTKAKTKVPELTFEETVETMVREHKRSPKGKN